MSGGSRRIWWSIQRLRHSPPGAASEGKRRSVFAAALTQAEELFDAAETVGPAARPIPLFYGLSQASRAIAAAHDQDDSPLRGHGITATRLDGPIEKVAVEDRGKNGSFIRSARLMQSGSLGAETSWGEIYSALPAVVEHLMPLEVRSAPALRLVAERLDNGGSYLVISSSAPGLVVGIPSDVQQSDDQRSGLSDLFSRYPSMKGWDFPSAPEYPLPWRPVGEELGVRIVWSVQQPGGSGEPHRRQRLREVTSASPDGHNWILPILTGNTKPLAPLISWWALLFPMSLLARYEPAAWLEHLNVDKSKVAVPLHALLDAGLSQIPALILQALVSPTAWLPPALAE